MKLTNICRKAENKEEPSPGEGGVLRMRDFIREVGLNAEAHGFHEASTSPGDIIALIHSELSEVLECFRRGLTPSTIITGPGGKPEGIPIELADVVIRCMDMADLYGIDLEAVILKKHEYNKTRPFLHGKKF